VEGLTEEERVGRARRLIAGAGLVGTVGAEDLVAASDRLRGFVEERWPGAVWRREVAVAAEVGGRGRARRVVGVIDLLVETDEGMLVLDHKTFPGAAEAAWRARTQEFRQQFVSYSEGLREVCTRTDRSGWIHLPVAGALVQLCPSANAIAETRGLCNE